MSILNRYLMRELLGAWLLMTLIFSAVFTLLLLLDEIDQVNERYTIGHAFLFLLKTLPTRIVDLAPVSVLLGTLLALGNLARHSEIIVMRTSGVSLRDMVRGMLPPVVGLVALLYLFSEYVAAPLHFQAETEREVVRSGRVDLLAGEGLWSNDGNRFINVRALRLGHIPQGIEVFHFDESGALLRYLRGREAEVTGDRAWTLQGVQRKDMVNDVLRTRWERSLDIGEFWLPEELPVLAQSPAGMAPSALWEYIRYLESTEQNSERFRFVFWQRITVPLAAAAMALLAAPIGAGLRNARGGTAGTQLAIGAMVGIAFYTASQITYNAGLIYGLPASFVALLPVVLVAGAGLWLLSRES